MRRKCFRCQSRDSPGEAHGVAGCPSVAHGEYKAAAGRCTLKEDIVDGEPLQEQPQARAVATKRSFQWGRKAEGAATCGDLYWNGS